MSGYPLVTVIIPAYNRFDYIDQTIRCVLDQTWPAIQLIVVDDGSTDGTLDRISSYGDRLELLTHPGHANRGQSASINLGLGHARGCYIAVLDSDDYWELNNLEILVDYLERHPDTGLVYSNGYGVDSEGKIIYRCYAPDHVEHNDPNRILLNCYVTAPASWLVRKTVYDGVGGFEESYRSAQDHDMLIRIAEVTRFAYLPDYLWYYRRHGNSISSTQQATRWETGFRILENARHRYPYRAATLRKRKAVLNYRMGKVRLLGRHYISAAGFLLRALLLDPARAVKVLLGMDRSR